VAGPGSPTPAPIQASHNQCLTTASSTSTHAAPPPPGHPLPQVGLRSSAFSKYVALQGLGLASTLVNRFPWIRDRMIADEKFLFKVGAEIVIDSGVCRGVFGGGGGGGGGVEGGRGAGDG
jgi:hypothetical protein